MPAETYRWLTWEEALWLLVVKWGYTEKRASEIIDAAEHKLHPETGVPLHLIRVP